MRKAIAALLLWLALALGASGQAHAQASCPISFSAPIALTGPSYTATNDDQCGVFVFTYAAGPVALALPAANRLTPGWRATLVAQGANVVVTPASGTINGGTSFTIAKGENATIYGSGISAYVVTGSGSAAAAVSVVSPYAYGAVCDGVHDDAVALQAWLNAASATVGLAIPNATCAFGTALSMPTLDFALAMVGYGPYQSVLKYIGTSTTGNLLTFGSAGSTGYNMYLANFRIYSGTTMTADAGIYIKKVGNSFLQRVVLDGQNGNGKLYNGLYADQVDSLYVSMPDAQAANDCYLVNGTVGVGAKADMTISGPGKVSLCVGAGLHVAGAFGGFVCDNLNVEHNGINYKQDTSLAAEGNREIFLGSTCILDAAQTGPNVQVNDALASGGTVSIGGWVGTTALPTTANIDMVNWNGKLSVSSSEIFNATGDGIRLRTANTYLSVSPATQIHENGGYGINCDAVTNLPRTIVAPFSNSSGAFGANCAIEAIPVTQGGTGGITGATARTGLGLGTGDSPTFTGLTLSGGNLLGSGDLRAGASGKIYFDTRAVIESLADGSVTFFNNAVGAQASINASTAAFNSLASDATHTDSTVCADSTSGLLYKGSGAAGICLGTSSLRFKHDVAPLSNGLPQILALEPISYRYNKGYGDDGNRLLYGFAAEQVVRVMPDLVGRDAEGRPNSVDWAGVVPVLVRAVQEQQQEIDAIKVGRR